MSQEAEFRWDRFIITDSLGKIAYSRKDALAWFEAKLDELKIGEAGDEFKETVGFEYCAMTAEEINALPEI